MPRVPILETYDYLEKTPWKWYNLDMEQFQLYKKVQEVIYSISEVASINIVSSSDVNNLNMFSLANMKMHTLFLDGNPLTKEQEIEVLKSTLGSKSREQMESLAREGWKDEDIVEHCREHGMTSEEEDMAYRRVLQNQKNKEVTF